MIETDKTLRCTCDDLTELERYYGHHYDGCPLSDYSEGPTGCLDDNNELSRALRQVPRHRLNQILDEELDAL